MDDHLTITIQVDRSDLVEFGQAILAGLAPSFPTPPVSGLRVDDRPVTASSHDRLMTVPEVCELLQVGRNAVYGWSYERTGPPVIRIGKSIRFRRSDVEMWLDEQAANPDWGGR